MLDYQRFPEAYFAGRDKPQPGIDIASQVTVDLRRALLGKVADGIA
jgi:hypothetical protein